MRRYFLLAIFFIRFGLLHTSGQTIKFELPAQKGKTLYLIANKGMQQDTVFSGQISEKGDLIFTPPKDKPLLSGVVSLFIKPDIKLSFIYSSIENMILRCEDDNIYTQNSQFFNSPENDFIVTHFPEQMQLQEKIMFCEQGLSIYNENENLHKALKEEKDNLKQQLIAFESILQEKSTKLYSARLMQIQVLMNNYSGRIQITSDPTDLALIKEYLLLHLDIETLYSSGFWFPAVNGMLGLYSKESPFYGQFGNDVAALLQKTKSQDVFLALTNDAAMICAQFGWNEDEIALSKYLVLSGRITDPQGRLKQMMAQYKFEPGMPAPKIMGGKSQYIDFGKSKTLVVFYESDCTHCTDELKLLSVNYQVFKEKGIEIVSIAADFNKDTFEKICKDLPWPTKLCDFKGFAGENFSNYSIMGTPTFFLIDNAGIIQGKYAGAGEIMATF